MSQSALWTEVARVVERYIPNEIMLDALLQWASNPTSKSAGYGLEENYPYIAKNLAARYGISKPEAEKRVAELRSVCDSLLEPRWETGEIRKALREALEREQPQRLLHQGVLRRLREGSEETRRALLMFVLLGKAGSPISLNNLTKPGDYYFDPQSEFQAYYKSIFGETLPAVRVVDEIVRCGANSELYWVPSPRAKSSRGPTLVEAVIPTVEEIEMARTRLPSSPDIPALLESQWHKGDFGFLRLIDIVSHSYLGVWRTDEPLPVMTNMPGFMGTHGQTVALSPVVASATREHIEVIKSGKMEDSRRQTENALVSVARKLGADAALGVLWTGMGEVLWRFELMKSPPFYVYLAPWLTTFPQSPGLSRISLNEKPHVLFIIPYQSRPSFLGCLERTSAFSLKDTRWEKSIGVLSDLRKTSEFQLLIGKRHSLLDQILAALLSLSGTLGASESRPEVVDEDKGSKGKEEGKEVSGKPGTATPKRESILSCFEGGYAVKPVDRHWLEMLQTALQVILAELGIECNVDSSEFQEGPRLVRANVKLGKGLRISKITQASPDIANKLFANRDLFHFSHDDDVPKRVRVESVPARGMVGIYVPRDDFQAIPLGALLPKLPRDNPLSFIVGVNVIGEPQFSNLDSMPHLLVAGQTGAGKSVFLNTMVVSLACQNEPSRLQFILIDPKGGLEFGPYEKLPHVPEGGIVKSGDEAVNILAVARWEMDARYAAMTEESAKGNVVRSIQEYNNLPGVTRMAYRVIMIDEFADLVLSKNGSTIVEFAQAIAQKGRAAGIHLVICTQRPSVKVIPGDIKAVIPSRLSFRLPTGVDSKVILDEPGAEDLLGKGDMFLKETMRPELRRFQGALVTNKEIQQFVRAASSF